MSVDILGTRYTVDLTHSSPQHTYDPWLSNIRGQDLGGLQQNLFATKQV